MKNSLVSLEVMAVRMQQVRYDEKWKKLIRRARLFRFLPFIDFACAAGSMAIGNVGPHSDFDLIVAARRGRIFTARFFSILAFDLCGWRRKDLDHGAHAADTICLNHFVTEESYRLSPPHDAYWHVLYRSLVPVFGKANKIKLFWKSNADWMGKERALEEDRRYSRSVSSVFTRGLESVLGRSLGDRFEAYIKRIQLNRIEKKLKPQLGFEPRFIVSERELELHLDTRRIKEFKASSVHKKDLISLV